MSKVSNSATVQFVSINSFSSNNKGESANRSFYNERIRFF